MKKNSALILNKDSADKGQIQNLVCNLLPAQCRLETLEGREHTVIPMVILVEGVHAGSGGPLYYPPEELSKTPQVWNHKPVVVYHPEINGVGISACDPSIVNTRKVGVMMNTRFEDGKLKSEAWIEKSRADAVDERIMAAVTANEMMELSTGVFIDVDDTAGDWNGESYSGIARNYRPDHLALLPDKVGACSIADGAGLMRNQAQDQKGMVALAKRFLRYVGLAGNEMSFSNIRESLSDALRARFNVLLGDNGPYLWVEDVYQNFVIYEHGGKLFRLGYTSTDAGVTLSDDDPVEVKRVTEYRTVEGAFVGNQDQSTEQQEDHMNKTTMIAAILAANCGWSDRKVLEGLSDDQVKVIHDGITKNSNGDGQGGDNPPPTNPPGTQQPQQPAQPASQPAQPASQPQQAPGTATTNVNSQMSVQDFIQQAPAGMREVLTNSMSVYQEEKDRLVESIVANKNNVFTKEDLSNRPLGELRNLARLAGVTETARQPNYAGQGMVPVDNAGGGEEVLVPPTLNFEADKK